MRASELKHQFWNGHLLDDILDHNVALPVFDPTGEDNREESETSRGSKTENNTDRECEGRIVATVRGS